MDSNPIAPFDMYTDEYIVWIEERKKEKETVRGKIIISLILLLSAVGSAFWFINLYFKNNVNPIVSFLLPFIVLWCPWILGFLIVKIQNKKIIYYVTNYRLIKLYNDKNKKIFNSYLKDLRDIKISVYPNNIVSLEFEWSNKLYDTHSCNVFENIDNAEEIQKLILEQKEKLNNRSLSFDIISQ